VEWCLAGHRSQVLAVPRRIRSDVAGPEELLAAVTDDLGRIELGARAGRLGVGDDIDLPRSWDVFC